MSARLKGMTWRHPRGYDPMVATSALWAQRTGVEITWDQRSLQDFESFPVEELARAYDLIVIDHPHVGQITAEGCLLPLDVPDREAERAAMATGSVGPSYRSYTWEGRQWAFPIDAATQVQAFVPDRITQPAATFEAVLDLARRGVVALPLRPPHSLMTFFTLAAHLGSPCAAAEGFFVNPDVGREVWARLRELASLVDAGDLGRDPIAVFERMVEPDSPLACAPYIYGYVSYAWEGFRPTRLKFTNIPTIDGKGPVGTALGGTGIAVSARSAHGSQAIDFAYFVASGEVQSTTYSAAGGQPGHAAAWEEFSVNDASWGFYQDTRATLESSYLRPRFSGYMNFQSRASERINLGLVAREDGVGVLDEVERLWAEATSQLPFTRDFAAGSERPIPRGCRGSPIS